MSPGAFTPIRTRGALMAADGLSNKCRDVARASAIAGLIMTRHGLPK